MAFIDHTLLISVAAVFLAPFVFVVMTSFMTGAQARTASLWPRPFQPSNYAEVFTTISLVRYTWNTLQIAVISTIGVLISSIPVAYALSRMRWRGRQTAFVLVLGTLMLPVQVTIVPLYIVFVRLGWIDHLTPLIVPAFFGDAFSIFLLRQFFMTIPEEMSDAARVDGGSEWQIMTRVIVPLAKPAIAAVALFSFLYSWNDLFGPLLFVGNNPASLHVGHRLDGVHAAIRDRVGADDGGLGADHAAGDRPVLLGAARVHRRGHPHRREGLATFIRRAGARRYAPTVRMDAS